MACGSAPAAFCARSSSSWSQSSNLKALQMQEMRWFVPFARSPNPSAPAIACRVVSLAAAVGPTPSIEEISVIQEELTHKPGWRGTRNEIILSLMTRPRRARRRPAPARWRARAQANGRTHALPSKGQEQTRAL